MKKYETMLERLRAAYKGDAIFRPSSIARTINCKGSAQLIARSQHAKRTSRWAVEGTAAHAVAEQALKGIRQPEEWTDRMVQITGEMGGFFVDEEMVESVNVYLDVVRSRVTPNVQLLVEQRMALSAMDVTNPILAENRGTADAVLLNKEAHRISIVDLKYGKGVMVAGDSPQLKNYGVLAIFNNPFLWKEVELVVSQPRAMYEPDRLKTFIFSTEELLNGFLGQLLESMYAALEPDAPLKTGSWCRWCPAKDAGSCPAIQEEALTIGAVDRDRDADVFTALSNVGPVPQTIVKTGEVIPPGGAIVMPDAGVMSPEDLAWLLDHLEVFEVFMKAAKERAAHLIETGVNVPNYTMEAREGNRKWKVEGSELQDILRGYGVKIGEMYEEVKIKSPAQIEKLMKPEFRKRLKDLVDRPMGNPILKRVAKPVDALVSLSPDDPTMLPPVIVNPVRIALPQ